MFTLIVNYFVEGKLKTIIKEFKTAELAKKYAQDLMAQGIELTDAHYGIYLMDITKIQLVTVASDSP